MNVVFCALLCEGLSETDHGQLGGRVVGLTKASEETGSRGGIDDTTILLFPEMGPGGSGTLVGAFDVYSDDEVPVLVLHVLEGDISKDTSIVYQDVNAAEVLDGGLDNLLAVLNAIVVGNSLASGSFDLVYNDICGLWLLVAST